MKKTFVVVGDGIGFPVAEAIQKNDFALINLTKDSGQPIEKIFICEKAGNDIPDKPVSALMGVPEPGDILILPRFCLRRDIMSNGESTLAVVNEHYLNPRRICQVPI